MSTTRAKAVAGAALRRDPATLLATDLAAAFPWLRRTALHVVRPEDAGQRWLVVEVPGSAPRVISPTMLARPEALSALGAVLVAEQLALPGEIMPTPLAELARLFVAGARSKVVAADVVRDLETYRPRTAELAAALRAGANAGPALTGSPEDFTLRFDLVLPNGGLDRWVLRGTRRSFVDAKRTPAAPAGSYHYPWVG